MTTWRRGTYTLTDDRRAVDVTAVHRFLTNSYWAKGIPRRLVERGIDHSLNLSLHHDGDQVGFARVITDFATFGYLADVYVDEPHRGKGLSKWMMKTLFAHKRLQGFRRWVLVTRDAHGLYAKNGFTPLAKAEVYMEKWDPQVYARKDQP